ncbi:cobalt-factor II C(20)-methyltransferase [Anaeromicrobium sp.]|jgi:sirohydrochlorin cobaltochelatase|uniref:cobalt-factor II C(20)-methyltransferase n=1 Tax=Anaeromicrobium sp. TaxID=1929132 RepID=UPI0025D4AAD7|nr:cobalt-factor II C(20)-methyltransferase [Anaeromicrobium sp.]
MMAKFYGIGTGPGDSSLVTIKAVKTLEKLDILVTPQPKEGGESLALSIVKEYIPESVQIKERHFPMNFNAEEKEVAWQSIAKEIIEDVKSGKNVGFVTLGDPMIYSTYVYILNRLDDEIQVETIPGISSFSNIASSNNFPLVMDRDPLVILPCTASEEKIDNTLANHDCIVLMKVYKNFKSIIEKIKKHGLSKHAILVSNSSLDSETTYTNIEEVSKEQISYFSTILINKNANV